jgi:hypothetical protein
MNDISPDQVKNSPDQNRRGYTIDIVIPVNRNSFIPLNRDQQSINDGRCIRQEERIVQLIK